MFCTLKTLLNNKIRLLPCRLLTKKDKLLDIFIPNKIGSSVKRRACELLNCVRVEKSFQCTQLRTVVYSFSLLVFEKNHNKISDWFAGTEHLIYRFLKKTNSDLCKHTIAIFFNVSNLNVQNFPVKITVLETLTRFLCQEEHNSLCVPLDVQLYRAIHLVSLKLLKKKSPNIK